MEEKTIEIMRNSNSSKKAHGYFKYTTDKKHKEKEKLRTLSFQKGANKYKKKFSKKGQWRNKKIKGETCPKGIPMNSCGKTWARIHDFYTDENLKEGFKFSYLWIIT